MANRCAGLDPTWAQLPTPAPIHAVASNYYSCPGAAFENEALTSALRASMAPAHGTVAAAAKASSFSSPATPSSSTSSASELLSSGQDAPAPALPRPAAGRSPAARAQAAPRGGRVSKRKPRPSRRAPTTYINADPANFRRLVQEITGLPVPVHGAFSSFPVASDVPAAAAAPTWTPAPAPAYVLPTLDTSAFLLDRPKAEPEDKSSSGGCASAATESTDNAAGAISAARDDDSSLLLELDAMMWFPTLESWTGINI